MTGRMAALVGAMLLASCSGNDAASWQPAGSHQASVARSSSEAADRLIVAGVTADAYEAHAIADRHAAHDADIRAVAHDLRVHEELARAQDAEMRRRLVY